VKATVGVKGKTVLRIYRLAAIDAPEVRGHQPGWQESRDALRSGLTGKSVTITVRGRDTKWRRPLAVVTVDGEDVGLAQVLNGHAWFYRQYARSLTPEERTAYEAAELEARQQHRGIWQQARPVPPWQWRKGKGR